MNTNTFCSQSSFPVIHKVGNIDIFVLLKFGNKLDVVISHINFISKQYDKCKFVLELVLLGTIVNLFLLEVVQRCQHCQPCVIWENSILFSF